VTDDETTGERTLAGDSALVGGETTLTHVEALLHWLLVDLQNALIDLPHPFNVHDVHYVQIVRSALACATNVFREALVAIVSVLAGLPWADDSGTFKQCEWSHS
jgi:hypothetical protein